MYQIMQLNQFEKLRNEMELIHKDCFDQFVAGVISWYQHEVTHPTVYFEKQTLQLKPPNIFNLFEYPNAYGEAAIKLFLDSECNYLMEFRKKSFADARDEAIDIFNNANAEYRELMLSDAGRVLDEYHFFYCYQDDAYVDNTFYYNPYVKEVW